MGETLLIGRKAAIRWCALAATAMVLAACSSGPNPGSSRKGKFDPKYGVSASARVATKRGEFRKGGGHYKIGRPYKVAGRTYVPKHQPNYNKTGKASWYGDDFHGRLTANGEIFDMHDLTAAHPTLPLPSYARVTNLKNGRSVIVRINDRGPYAHNRIIDLSKRVAEVLDFKRDGITNVRVKYVGKARMDGEDARYLEASFRKRGQRIGDDRRAVPSKGQQRKTPPRVMVASAKRAPKATKRDNYLLAHVPAIGSPAPSPIALASAAPTNAWAPVDLVGDGYISSNGGKAQPTIKFAPIQLNYAATQTRIAAGYSAIQSMMKAADHAHLITALSKKQPTQSVKSVSTKPNLQRPPITIGTFQAPFADRLAEEFAVLAAVNMEKLPNGMISLSLTRMKPGVRSHDIATLKQILGLSDS